MKKISVQYFTSIEELFSFCKKICSINNLYAAHLYSLDKTDYVKPITCDYFNDANDINLNTFNCFVLSREILNTSKHKHYDFQIDNPNALYINVGEIRPTYIRESWMYALKIINNKDDHKTWLQVEKELKKEILAGGWGVYRPTMEKKFYKDLRYTQGARALYKKGITMFSSVGFNISFELEKE